MAWSGAQVHGYGLAGKTRQHYYGGIELALKMEGFC